MGIDEQAIQGAQKTILYHFYYYCDFAGAHLVFCRSDSDCSSSPLAGVYGVRVLSDSATTILQQVTTYGIRIGKELYVWQELGRFWFDKKHGQTLLIVEVARFPNRLTMVLADKEQKPELIELLSEVLLYQRPDLTRVEKASKWLEKKFPLEIE